MVRLESAKADFVLLLPRIHSPGDRRAGLRAVACTEGTCLAPAIDKRFTVTLPDIGGQ